MKKILWYSDCLSYSGFSVVAHNLLRRLKDDFEIEVFAINYFGEPYHLDTSPFCYLKDLKIVPAWDPMHNDMFGTERFKQRLLERDYDILFSLQDLAQMERFVETIKEANSIKKLKWVHYFPVDSTFKKSDYENVLRYISYPVPYTKYAQKEVFPYRQVLNPIYHGTDTVNFRPLAREIRKENRRLFFGLTENDIIVGNVNRNQPRKDLPRSILAFSEFLKVHPEAYLYLHCSNSDIAGSNLRNLVGNAYSKDLLSKILLPDEKMFKNSEGVSYEVMNHIYNTFDMLISTTMGEGWGLSLTEAMACGIPVVAPDNSSISEILSENRGYLVKSGGNLNLYHTPNRDVSRWPLTDVNDLVNKMCQVMKGDNNEVILNAYKFVTKYNWDFVAGQWRDLLNSIK
jgi:glycosyltransferase involved in cell wall biosynthesis